MSVDDQLTKTQVLAMVLLGICAWAVFIGLGYAAFADVADGLVITCSGGLGCWALIKWLIYVNESKDQ